MCRWLAYSGGPIVLERALFAPAHSLIDQSLHSRLGAEATNGDGYGIGWYDDFADRPGMFKSIDPAWNDSNLRELSRHIRSGHFFAHIRAAIGSAVQQTNCHPFRHDGWLFMHNGYIGGYQQIKRDLTMAVDESLYSDIAGQADTEVLFYLAITFGLQDDPPAAISRAIGFVEEAAARKGVRDAFQGTIATTDGKRTWAFRYATEGKPRSLFFTRDVTTLRRLYPDRAIVHEVSDDARLIVSEPIGDLPGAWIEVPESSYGVTGGDEDQLLPFVVKAPVHPVAV